MGKRNIYTSIPKRPILAKVAWFLFSTKGDVESLYFDASKGRWVGKYSDGQVSELPMNKVSDYRN